MVLNFSPSPTFFICNTKVFAPNELHSTRRYSKSVLLLMMDGELSFLENGHKITLLPGEYYIQREGLLQEGVPLQAPPIYFYIEFNASYSDDSFGLPLRGTFNGQQIVPLLERFQSLFKSHRTDLFRLNSYMLRVFSELLATSNPVNEKYNTAHLVRNYMDANYASHLTMDDIARQFGYAKDYITRIFKEQFHITPHQYLINLRMEQARWMLESTGLSAEQIALAVGYSDFSAFYRCFRKAFGISPGAVRPSREKR